MDNHLDKTQLQILTAAFSAVPQDGQPPDWQLQFRAPVGEHRENELVMHLRTNGASEVRLFRRNTEFACIIFAKNGQIRHARVWGIDSARATVLRYLEPLGQIMRLLGHKPNEIKLDSGGVLSDYLQEG